MTDSMIAHIALGSNLGDRRASIASALDALREHPAIEVVKVSRLIETEPVGYQAQGRFLNGAAELRTSLAPRELLDACMNIERSLGRERVQQNRCGPRTIDLDLILCGDRVIEEPGLSVPHPRMHERSFVLIPLAEIAPTAVHPTLGQTVQAMLERLVGRPSVECNGGAPCLYGSPRI